VRHGVRRQGERFLLKHIIRAIARTILPTLRWWGSGIVDHALPQSAEEAHIMGMPAPQPVSTIEDLLALPEDGMRHELLNGEHVMTPAPAVDHQRVVQRLLVLLVEETRSESDVEVLGFVTK
jgi:hypothetical protein